MAPIGSDATTTITASGTPDRPSSQPAATTSSGCSRFFTAEKRQRAAPVAAQRGRSPASRPPAPATSGRRHRPAAAAAGRRGREWPARSARTAGRDDRQRHRMQQRIAQRHQHRGRPHGAAPRCRPRRSSRITASSSTSVALVSSTVVCTVYSVNSVTRPGLAPGQAHQRRADHHRVAEGGGQRQHGRAPVEAAHQQRAGEDHDHRQEIRRHRPEVQLLHLHLAHGAKQQRRREQQEHQVRQVLHRARRRPSRAAPPGNPARSAGRRG